MSNASDIAQLIGKQFHVRARNETRGTRGVYQGVILEDWGMVN